MARKNAKDLAILVVDDTKFGRAVFYSALNHAGYVDVRIAESAPKALETLSHRRADVVVADWLMPEMDGLELTQRIREQDERRHSYTAIILATAQEGTGPLVTAFKRGVDDFIRKPFDNEELVARVYAAGRTANLQTALLETAERLSHSNRQLSEDSMTDSLTKLGNRNYLCRQLAAQMRVLESRGGGVCVAVLSVENLAELVASTARASATSYCWASPGASATASGRSTSSATWSARSSPCCCSTTVTRRSDPTSSTACCRN